MSTREPVRTTRINACAAAPPSPSLLRACGQWPAFYLALMLLGSIQIVWAVLAFTIRHVVSEERGEHIGRRVISSVFRHYFRLTGWLGVLEVEATALDAIDPGEAQVIAPNHPTVLDALILISRLENLNCIMKASVLDNVLLGAGARLAGYIRNDGPRRMLRLSTEHLRDGGQLIVFPEATRTRVAPVNEFKCGFAAMARAAQVPIQTVLIETDTPYLSKGWPALKKPKQLPMRFHARLGERFDVAPGEDIGAFVEALHAYFARELADAELGALWTGGAPVSVDDAEIEAGPGRDDVRDDSRGEPRTDPRRDPPALPPLTTSRWG